MIPVTPAEWHQIGQQLLRQLMVGEGLHVVVLARHPDGSGHELSYTIIRTKDDLVRRGGNNNRVSWDEADVVVEAYVLTDE